jgi:hypothetical protein
MKRARMFRRVSLVAASAFAAPILMADASLASVVSTIDARSNIYGAGHSEPPAPGGGGAGLLPVELPFVAALGQTLTFSSVVGSISYNGGGSWLGPEGYDPWLQDVSFPSWNGISGITTYSYEFLAGVFLDDIEPSDPAPANLNFGYDGLTRNFEVVGPDIGQLFFIGDGFTDSGLNQTFLVPATATRLFLGFIDTASPTYLPGSYQDNLGSLTATLDLGPAPIAIESTSWGSLKNLYR